MPPGGGGGFDAAALREVIATAIESKTQGAAMLKEAGETKALLAELLSEIKDANAWLGQIAERPASGFTDSSKPFDVRAFVAEGAARAGSMEALITSVFSAFPQVVTLAKEQTTEE